MDPIPRVARDHVILKFKAAAQPVVAGLGREAALERLRVRLDLPAGTALEEPVVTRLIREKNQAKRAGAGAGAEKDPDGDGALDWDRFHYVRIPPGVTVETVLDRLKDHPLLEYAEADGMGTGGEVLPNDAQFVLQWHHRNMAVPGADIKTPLAWDITTGSSNMIVAVMDSGLAPGLPEFAGREVAGYDFVNNDLDPADDHGHGTAVAGTILANANNGFMGAGVDWSCRVMPIKVLNASNSGFYSDWAQGLDWAVANGAKVVNLSAGGDLFNATLAQSIDAAIAAGVIFVTITHNDSKGVIRFPGSLNQSITVGATSSLDRKTSLSNWGPQIDLVAPGEGIYSVSRFNTFGSWNGTSFAAPLVSGVCALMAGLRPDLTQEEASLYLSLGAEDQVGDANDTPGFDSYYGWGRLNAFRSVRLAATNVASLVLTQTDNADPSAVDCPVTYDLTVNNNTLAPVFGVWVTNEFAVGIASMTGAQSAQGTHTVHGNSVVFELGTLPARGVASMSVTVMPSIVGVMTNVARVASVMVVFDPVAHQTEETTAVTYDRDGDGMPDKWELAHGLDPDDPLDAMTDLDGDGMVNVDEWEAGTDPGDPGSVLRVADIEVTESGVRLWFLAISNRSYSVLHRESPTEGAWLKVGDVEAGPTNRLESVTDSDGARGQGRYYRLTTPKRL